MLSPYRRFALLRLSMLALTITCVGGWLIAASFLPIETAHANTGAEVYLRRGGTDAESAGRFVDRIGVFGQSSQSFYTGLLDRNGPNATGLLNFVTAGSPPPPPPSGPIVTVVIGDQDAVVGNRVYFYGAKWSRKNSLSGGPAPASFKGYANKTNPNPPNCGGTWKAEPGNSSRPPRDLPDYMTILVASSITKSGSVIAGNIVKMVVIRTEAHRDDDECDDDDHGDDRERRRRHKGIVVSIVCGGGGGACTPGSVCRASAGSCDVAEVCTANGQCPADSFLPSSSVCRSSAGVCDTAEACTGASAACPNDAKAAAGTTCRSSAGVCDVAESCDGASSNCPTNAFLPSTTVCRGSANQCDAAERCTGSGVSCPADANVPNGMTCNDGDACTNSDICTNGGCSGATTNCNDNNACTADSCNNTTGCANTPINCNDNNVCTADSCDPATGCRNTTVNVDDSNACTTDSCDPATGVTHTPVNPDDGNACTADSCDPATGVSHTPVNVDDGNACTTDSCDPATGVTHTGISCDDNNRCTADSCNPASGCVNTTIDPNDNNACTVDSCDPATGVSHTPVNSDDGNACTTDSCDSATGVTHTPVNPDDGNACTTDSCDPATGVSHTPVNADDGNACTTDSCDPATGVTHTGVSCDDNNRCTADSCNPASGCVNTTIDPNDNNACTVDSCDPATGVSHTPVNPDDGNACTVDSCDPATGVNHTPVNPDDGNACTTDSCDPATGVSHTPVNVDDGNACTTDSCDPATGVSHTPVNVDDGNACTTDSCDPATGVQHTPVNSDDGNACTTDSCDPETGVSHTNNTNPCDDSLACTNGDQCSGGSCTGTPIACGDGEVCVEPDGCTTPNGTLHIQVLNGNGLPVQGILVEVDPSGSQNMTDDNGIAQFSGLAGPVIVQVEDPRYAPASKSVNVPASETVSETIRLLDLGPPKRFDSADGVMASGQGVTVTIPPGSLRDSAGNPLTGFFDIFVTPLDPSTQVNSAPGPFRGIAAGNIVQDFESFFMANFTVKPAGNPNASPIEVQFAPTAPATIDFTLPPSASALLGELIPAWHYDVDQALWVQEGFGTVSQGGDGNLHWTAQVTHFTWWNCDRPWTEKNCYRVTVTDPNDLPISGATVTATGVDYEGYTNAVTGQDGMACLDVKSNSTVEFSASHPAYFGLANGSIVRTGNLVPAACDGQGGSCFTGPTLKLALDSCLSGVVTMTDGITPAPNAKVFVVTPTITVGPVTTGSDGSFCVPAPPAQANTLTVYAFDAEGYAQATVPFATEPNRNCPVCQTLTTTLVLQSHTYGLRGQAVVRDEAGNVSPGAGLPVRVYNSFPSPNCNRQQGCTVSGDSIECATQTPITCNPASGSLSASCGSGATLDCSDGSAPQCMNPQWACGDSSTPICPGGSAPSDCGLCGDGSTPTCNDGSAAQCDGTPQCAGSATPTCSGAPFCSVSGEAICTNDATPVCSGGSSASCGAANPPENWAGAGNLAVVGASGPDGSYCLGVVPTPNEIFACQQFGSCQIQRYVVVGDCSSLPADLPSSVGGCALQQVVSISINLNAPNLPPSCSAGTAIDVPDFVLDVKFAIDRIPYGGCGNVE